jgi:hypothetical protein
VAICNSQKRGMHEEGLHQVYQISSPGLITNEAA